MSRTKKPSKLSADECAFLDRVRSVNEEETEKLTFEEIIAYWNIMHKIDPRLGQSVTSDNRISFLFPNQAFHLGFEIKITQCLRSRFGSGPVERWSAPGTVALRGNHSPFLPLEIAWHYTCWPTTSPA